MTEVRVVGHASGRDLCAAELGDVQRSKLDLPSALRPYVLFTAFDAGSITDDQLDAFAESMLRSGCAYSCAWGVDAGRVEEAFDQVAMNAELAGEPFVEEVLMTTSHESEALDEALWFAVFDARPARGDAHAVVALCDPEHLAHVEERLADTKRWSDEVLEQDEGPRP
jgi:hypothetical protein